jgi:hypothetical protein
LPVSNPVRRQVEAFFSRFLAPQCDSADCLLSGTMPLSDRQRIRHDPMAASWTAVPATDDRRTAWQEDAAQIDAEVAHVTSDQLQLRLHLVREVKEENYRLAQVPFLCPDARPNQATSARSAIYERGLAEAREIAMSEMQARAQELGASAVVGIDLDYEVLGQNNGMLMVSVSGTAVVC